MTPADVQALLSSLPPISGSRPIALERLAGGRSNPTFLLRDICGGRHVLRTRPAGQTNPTAHRIDREVRVLRALQNSGVPVPVVEYWCPAPTSGEPWYVMTHVEGIAPEDPALPMFNPIQRRIAWNDVIDALSALHRLEPVDVGMGDFGPPTDFNTRQIARWLARSREHEAPAALLELGDRLANNPPIQRMRTVVHGDYRFGNLILTVRSGQLAAVVDWELSTIGDPMADLAYLSLAFSLPPRGSVLPGLAGVVPPDGTPTLEAMLGRYTEATGRPLPADWPRHRALALFRSAAIALGVHRRGATECGTIPSTAKLSTIATIAALGLDQLPSRSRRLT